MYVRGECYRKKIKVEEKGPTRVLGLVVTAVLNGLVMINLVEKVT